MPTHVLVVYYSVYGHIYRMAQAVEEGARGVPDTEVRLRRVAEIEEVGRTLAGSKHYQQSLEQQQNVPEATHDDLRWADGICWGTPTR
jgi:NAD(P)H dehydrogenase (quinone)